MLFEGSARAVDAQVDAVQALVGGTESDDEIWAESRRLQAEAKTHVRFAPGELREHLADLPKAAVRPSAGVAYVSEERPSVNLTQGPSADALAALEERILRAFDPKGTLGG